MLRELEKRIEDLRLWMNENRLKLNDSKTEFLILGSKHMLKHIFTASLHVGEERISATSAVRNIGASFDCEMRMATQVRNMCKGAWLNLCSIGKVRWFLSDIQTKSVVHAYVTSKLDCNNTLLAGIPSILTSQLQRVQNAAARLVT